MGRLNQLDRHRGAPASPLSAASRPRSVSAAGWIPRASSRSSPVASFSSSSEASISSAASSGVARDPVSRQAQVDAERHQPLLSAVVEVSLEPPPLVVSGVTMREREARSSSTVARKLRVQPLILECERCGGADCLHEVALVGEVGVVDDRGDPPSLMLDGGDDLSRRAPDRPALGRPSAST